MEMLVKGYDAATGEVAEELMEDEVTSLGLWAMAHNCYMTASNLADTIPERGVADSEASAWADEWVDRACAQVAGGCEPGRVLKRGWAIDVGDRVMLGGAPMLVVHIKDSPIPGRWRGEQWCWYRELTSMDHESWVVAAWDTFEVLVDA